MTLYTEILYTPPKNLHERILTTFNLQRFFDSIKNLEPNSEKLGNISKNPKTVSKILETLI